MPLPKSALVCLAIAFALLVHGTSAGWHVLYGPMNTDEGFYAICTRSVANGEMPYRDFGFTQPPLVLYANALPLRIAGFGLFAQRIVNGLWAAGALALGAVWLARRSKLSWGLGVALLFSLSVPWMYFIHLGKTYGFTTLLVMVAGWAFLALENTPRRNFVLGVLATVGVWTRLPAAPYFGLLWLLALWPGRRPSAAEVAAAGAGAGLTALAVVLPIWLAAPEATKFWVYDFHRLSVPNKLWHLSWEQVVTLAPAVWLIALVAGVVLVRRRAFAQREAGVMLAALVTLAANLLLEGVYEEYGVPFLLPLAVAGAALISDEATYWRRPAVLLLGLSLAAAQLFAPLIVFKDLPPNHRFSISAWLPAQTPPFNTTLPAELAAARQLIASNLAPDAPFIGTNIILAAETGRFVPAELRMGPFSFTAEIPPDRAARLHLVTHEQLDVYFARPEVTTLAFFQRRELDYGWSMPSFDTLREDLHAQWFAPLRRDFRTAPGQLGLFVIMIRKK